MKTITHLFLAGITLLGIALNVNANNIQVANCGLINQNTSAGANNPANHTFIRFDLS